VAAASLHIGLDISKRRSESVVSIDLSPSNTSAISLAHVSSGWYDCFAISTEDFLRTCDWIVSILESTQKSMLNPDSFKPIQRFD
jgi:hypothetical protein